MNCQTSRPLKIAQTLRRTQILERITRMWRRGDDDQRPIVPSPLAEEGQGEGYSKRTAVVFNSMSPSFAFHPSDPKECLAPRSVATPLPVPPPPAGGERGGARLRAPLSA